MEAKVEEPETSLHALNTSDEYSVPTDDAGIGDSIGNEDGFVSGEDGFVSDNDGFETASDKSLVWNSEMDCVDVVDTSIDSIEVGSPISVDKEMPPSSEAGGVEEITEKVDLEGGDIISPVVVSSLSPMPEGATEGDADDELGNGSIDDKEEVSEERDSDEKLNFHENGVEKVEGDDIISHVVVSSLSPMPDGATEGDVDDELENGSIDVKDEVSEERDSDEKSILNDNGEKKVEGDDTISPFVVSSLSPMPDGATEGDVDDELENGSIDVKEEVSEERDSDEKSIFHDNAKEKVEGHDIISDVVVSSLSPLPDGATEVNAGDELGNGIIDVKEEVSEERDADEKSILNDNGEERVVESVKYEVKKESISEPNEKESVDVGEDTSAAKLLLEAEEVKLMDVEEIDGSKNGEVMKEGDMISDCEITKKEIVYMEKADDEHDKSHDDEKIVEEKAVEIKIEVEETNETKNDSDEHEKSADEEEEGHLFEANGEEDKEEMIFGSTEAAKQFIKELQKTSSGEAEKIDGQIVSDSDDEEDGKPFDPAALAALLKAATNGNSEQSDFTLTAQDGTKVFTVERPSGLGSSLRTAKQAAPSPNGSTFVTQPHATTAVEPANSLSQEERKKVEELQSLCVKYLRLLQRLGNSEEDSIATQVLYRLSLLAGSQAGELFSIDAAKIKAMELEAEGKNDLDFSLNVLVLGKAGVGKSATINSIFGDKKISVDAFEHSTSYVREITGTISGVEIKVIDTPGLKSSAMDQSRNLRILSSVKKVIKRCPVDIVLYVDRLDAQTRGMNNLPLLRTMSASLGSSIWKNAVVGLTHAASAPPDGPDGTPLNYDVFVAQCSHIVQQSIGQAVGDLRMMNPSLMNPVCLIENHLMCRKNREGEKVLPNGLTWRPQMLLLSYSMKIFSEANSILKSREPSDYRRLFGFQARSPPLPYLLSWLMQSRTHPKLPSDEGGDDDGDDDDVSDSEMEEEYDQLPPFKPLRRIQLEKLTKEQKKAYFEEYDYRVKLLQKKQWREELQRRKTKGKKSDDSLGNGDDLEDVAPATVPVPLPDMVLPPSFDSGNHTFRYRFLEPTSQLLTRPVLDTHGWDHDCGYDGVNVEHGLAVANRFPAAVTAQLTKDKKEFNIQMDSSVAVKHGDDGSSMAGFDIQNVGKQLAYVVRGETKFKNMRKNKTTLGGSVTFLGENVAAGVKLEDQIAIGKRLVLVGTTGTVRSQGDSVYGANLEVRLRETDFPIGQDQSSLGLSLVKWKGDLAIGGNLQSQVSIGRQSKIMVRAGLNNKMSGQITVRTSSSDQLQIAVTVVLPIIMAIYKSIRPGDGSGEYSMY